MRSARCGVAAGGLGAKLSTHIGCFDGLAGCALIALFAAVVMIVMRNSAVTRSKSDVDEALLSRFSSTLYFGLPSVKARQAIFARYAQQLPAVDLSALASLSDGMSARDIKHVCEATERRWASRRFRGEVTGSTPPLGWYEDSIRQQLDDGDGAGRGRHLA